MRLSIKALALTLGIIWAAAVFLVGVCNLIWPSYGTSFLQLAASIYPGYELGGFGSVIVGTLYAFVDAVVAGAIFAWLYNKLAGSRGAAG
ncbi:MAG: bacteriophage holin [Gemmatimonadota bacterium]|nr:MAG: bacteriophage holin [Gemmatimonadota bacterium]